MRLQETYLERPIRDGHALVIKTYDCNLAYQAFSELGADSLEDVSAALKLENEYAPEHVPSPDSPAFQDFLWDALSDEAREDGNVKSFFIVYRQISGQSSRAVYVSADWPSAQAFAERL